MLKNIKKYYFLMAMMLTANFICIMPMYNSVDWDFWARLAVGKIFFQTGHV